MTNSPHVLICGGGHVGREVARLCDQVEYRYSVLDDRAEFASRERFPTAVGLFVARPEQFFPDQDLEPYSQVMLLGYSYKIDTEALYQCVSRFPGGIGMICSRLKRREMFNSLRERGVSEQQLRRVEAPLGLPIGAETCAEIAVSIVGSIIAHYRGAQRSAGDKDDEESKVQPAA